LRRVRLRRVRLRRVRLSRVRLNVVTHVRIQYRLREWRAR